MNFEFELSTFYCIQIFCRGIHSVEGNRISRKILQELENTEKQKNVVKVKTETVELQNEKFVLSSAGKLYTIVTCEDKRRVVCHF